MRLQHNQNFVFGNGVADVGKQVTQQRNLRKTGNPAHGFDLLLLEDPSQNVDFPLLETNIMFDHPLPDNGLLDAADIHLLGDRRNFDPHFQGNFAVLVDLGGDVQVYAHIRVLKLGLHQRADHRATDPRLEAAGSDGDAVADAQRGFLPIRCADFRPLQDSGVGITQQGVELGAREGNGNIVRAHLANLALRPRCRDLDIRGKTKLLGLIAAHFHDRCVHHHFRFCLIHVADDFLRQGHFVRRVPNNDGVHRVDLLDAPGFQQGSDSGHDLG